jgi:hypothetical protein
MQREHEPSVDARFAALLPIESASAHAQDLRRVLDSRQSRSETRVPQFATGNIIAAFSQF